MPRGITLPGAWQPAGCVLCRSPVRDGPNQPGYHLPAQEERYGMIPQVTQGPGPEAEFQAFLRQGRFMIQRSRSSGEYVFYPRVAAPRSGAADLEWVAASGLGRIYSITVNRTRTESYNIALVQLDEGPRLMSRIDGVETAPIGTRVRARIVEEGDRPLLVFEMVDQDGGA
jgi:uncharacterized protein